MLPDGVFRRREAAGPNPDLLATVGPRLMSRTEWGSDLFTVDLSRLKMMATGDTDSVRDLHAGFEGDIQPTTTPWMAVNTADWKPDKLGLDDAAVEGRLRVVPFGAVPPDKRIDDLRTTIMHEPAVRQAVVAKLVRIAAQLRAGVDPDKDADNLDHPDLYREGAAAVKAASEGAKFEGLGGAGLFIRENIVAGGDDDKLTMGEVWADAVKMDPSVPDDATPKDVREVFGVRRPKLMSMIKGMLPVGNMTTKKGAASKGSSQAWRGWRLVSWGPREEPEPEPPPKECGHECAHPDAVARYPMPDGCDMCGPCYEAAHTFFE